MTQRYYVVPLPDSQSALDPRRLAQVLARDGQLLLPMLDLIEDAQLAIDDLNVPTRCPAAKFRDERP